MATINNIGGTGYSGYAAAAISPAERLAPVSARTPSVNEPLPFPTDPIDFNGNGVVTQGEIAQSLRPRQIVQEAPTEQPQLPTTAFAELAAPQEDAAAESTDAEVPATPDQQVAEQAAAERAAASEGAFAAVQTYEPQQPEVSQPAARAVIEGFGTTPAAASTTSTATSATTATVNGSAIADAESAVTSMLGEIASRSYGAVQSPASGRPAVSLVA